MDLSFVIPCKNEDRYISRCIDSILRQKSERLNIEIIVVDNGSTDNTIELLKSYGENIKLYICPDLKIAELRNFGVKNCNYSWVAFIDADVEVHDDWGDNLYKFIGNLENNGVDIKQVITGSTCIIPEGATWVEKLWYEQIIARDVHNAKYINSGNMIIHKQLFNTLGGFDPGFITGEEEKLCRDAPLCNGIIIKNEEIKAVHHGYPKNILTFFKRMRWHGLGMKWYIKNPWKSKPLLLAIYYVILVSVFVCLLIFSGHYVSNTMLFIALFVILQSAPVYIYAKRRSVGGNKNIMLLTYLYVVYGWAKVFALFDILTNKNNYRKSSIKC